MMGHLLDRLADLLQAVESAPEDTEPEDEVAKRSDVDNLFPGCRARGDQGGPLQVAALLAAEQRRQCVDLGAEAATRRSAQAGELQGGAGGNEGDPNPNGFDFVQKCVDMFSSAVKAASARRGRGRASSSVFARQR